MPAITRIHAQQIVKKLSKRPEDAGHAPFAVEETSGKRHDIYKVRYRGKWIAQFNIRRGSNSNLPHAFVAAQLHMSPRQGVGFAECSLTLDAYIGLLLEKGIITGNE